MTCVCTGWRETGRRQSVWVPTRGGSNNVEGAFGGGGGRENLDVVKW